MIMLNKEDSAQISIYNHYDLYSKNVAMLTFPFAKNRNRFPQFPCRIFSGRKGSLPKVGMVRTFHHIRIC